MKTALAIFTKYPDPGNVKTRLAQSIGDELSSGLHKAILSDLVCTHSGKEYDLLLCITPPESRQRFAELFPGTKILHQSAGDLGLRLHHATAQILADYDRVAIIGSDCIVTPEDIRKSIIALDSHDITLGPAEDGGYYLIALKRAHAIFDGIDWSTPEVFFQQMRNIRAKNLCADLLDTRYDIDTIDDLERLRRDITAAFPETFSFLELV